MLNYSYYIAKKWLRRVTSTAGLKADNAISPDAGDFIEMSSYVTSKIGLESGQAALDGDGAASQEIAVTLATTKPNTTYKILLTVEEGTITVADQGKLQAFVKTGTKATTGFTIKLETALAAGEDVTVNWLVVD